MNATLYIEIDGQPVKLTDALWLQFAPCGCLCGLANAERAEAPLLTEMDARVTFTSSHTKREAQRDADSGFVVRLVTFAAYKAGEVGQITATCPHTPRWGIDKTPVPDGYAWARESRLGRCKVRHLAPVDAIDNWANREKAPSFCGGVQNQRLWTADEWMGSETYECSRCVSAARKAAAA